MHFHSDPRKWPNYVMLGIKSHMEVAGEMNLGVMGQWLRNHEH